MDNLDINNLDFSNFGVRYELIKKINRDIMIDPNMDFRHPKVVASFFRNLQYLALEKHICCFLDTSGRCLGTLEFNGDEFSVRIPISAVAACSVLSGAKYVIFLHNHPSHLIDGELTFSKNDIDVIDKFTWMLGVFGITFWDSVIISADRYTSHKMQKAEKERKEKLDAYQRGELVLVSEEIPKSVTPGNAPMTGVLTDVNKLSFTSRDKENLSAIADKQILED